MNTSPSLQRKQPVSFRWDSDLVRHLKKIAERDHRSLSNLTEVLLSSWVKSESMGLDDTPNEITLASLKEAKEHQTRIANGGADNEDYIDTSSVEAMIKSTLG